MTPTHARQLRSSLPLHTKTLPIAAPPLHATNSCAPTARGPISPNQRAPHLCPAPGCHQLMRADCAGPHPSTRRLRPSLPCARAAPTPARRLRSPPPFHTNAPHTCTNLPPYPCMYTTVHPRPCPAHINTPRNRSSLPHPCTAPTPTRRLRSPSPRPPARRPSSPCPCTRPSLARRLRSPKTLQTTLPLMAAPPLHATNPCAPTKLSPTFPHQDAANRCPTLSRHPPLRAGSSLLHPSAPSRCPSLLCHWMTPTHARRLRSSLPLHTKTLPIAAPPLHATNPFAPTARAPTSPNQRATHLCPAPGCHQLMRADCAGPYL